MHSTFPDKATAEKAVTETLRAHRDDVLAYEGRRVDYMRPLRLCFPEPLGIVLTRDGQELEPKACAVILRRDEVAGFVYNAYPEPERTAPTDWPALDVYLGGYLHQDWRDEFASPLDAFEALLPLLPVSEIERMVAETAELLGRDDRQLQAIMRELSLYLDTRLHLGIEEREWLRRLQDRATAEITARTAAGN